MSVTLRNAQVVHAVWLAGGQKMPVTSGEVVIFDSASYSCAETGRALVNAMRKGFVDRVGYERPGGSLWVMREPGHDLLKRVGRCAYEDIERELVRAVSSEQEGR